MKHLLSGLENSMLTNRVTHAVRFLRLTLSMKRINMSKALRPVMSEARLRIGTREPQQNREVN